MKKYTYEDWLNDKIDYRIPGEIPEGKNELFMFFKGEDLFRQLMTKQDYEQVKKHQLAAYDTALEMIVNDYIKNFREIYDGSSYKVEYLNNEIRMIQEFFDKDLDRKKNVLAGFKDWSCIKGSEYQKIMKGKALFDSGKFVRLREFGEFKDWALNDNMKTTALYKYLQWLIEFQEQQENMTRSGIKQTNTEKLKDEFNKYGFFDLPMVKQLTNGNKEKLIEIISSNKLPYKIAMIDYLGLIKHLDKEYFTTYNERNKKISKWFNSDEDGRAVKGYINSLASEPETGRYKAHLHKNTVQKDHQKLKKGELSPCCP